MLALHLRRPLRRGLALTASLLAGLLVGEALVRLVDPPLLNAAGPLTRLDARHPFHPDAGRYVLDDELGYRPNPNHPAFHATGCLARAEERSPPPKRPRLLLLGDSVVERGHLSRALEAELAQRFDVWSLGVSGYSTPEEVALFERVVEPLAPRRVLLVFSYNDLARTPMRFLDDSGRLVLSFGERPFGLPARWLGRCYLLRLALAVEARRDPLDDRQHRERVRSALRRLMALCEARDIELSALVQPLIAPSREVLEDPSFQALRRGVAQRHRANLELFRELGLPALDLEPVIARALERGTPTGELPGDVHHPSPELAATYAKALAATLATDP
jgi:hypothetical protein